MREVMDVGRLRGEDLDGPTFAKSLIQLTLSVRSLKKQGGATNLAHDPRLLCSA